ncbi:Hypothetical protein PBC10988_28460 [Planctomycetales bacterium 10988]|nr:Hypothetical protein PBC10988_28460 [Planctomycetales bacterium 10988]
MKSGYLSFLPLTSGPSIGIPPSFSSWLIPVVLGICILSIEPNCLYAQFGPATPPTPQAQRTSEPLPGPFGSWKEGELVKLHPDYPVWLDKSKKQVVLQGQVCLQRGQLEMLATLRGGKEHESVVSVPTTAQLVHASLIAIGAEPGKPVQYRPEFAAPSGPVLEILVRWIDHESNLQEVHAQDWVRYSRTKREMNLDFVFAGSFFAKDAQGDNHYAAESGDFICVSNFPSAMADVSHRSSADAADLFFEAFYERIPPIGTPVTLVIRPQKEAQAKETPNE